MRILLFCSVLFFVFGSQNVLGQCDYITPPAIKKINYAKRQVTFSDVTMNGQKTTYLAVRKGQKVKMSTKVSAKKNGDYCPNCIVQIYWGIKGHSSVCAKSFHGYQFNRKKSTLTFNAPMRDGIYYVTMGSSLDYSCKNNKNRPNCSSDYAIAVIKVGNPDPEKKMTLTKTKQGSRIFLNTTLVKSGCFGKLDKLEWFLNDEKLAYDNKKQVPLMKFGTYKAVWSNCLESVEDSFTHNLENKNIIASPAVEIVSEPTEDVSIDALVQSSNKFVLENLIFDLGKSLIKPEAKKDLDKLAQIMKGNPAMRILLEGHTDRRGNARKNLALSKHRVDATKKYLIKQGVKKSNIETKGWGQQRPLIITDEVEKGKINRRVEIQILSR